MFPLCKMIFKGLCLFLFITIVQQRFKSGPFSKPYFNMGICVFVKNAKNPIKPVVSLGFSMI